MCQGEGLRSRRDFDDDIPAFGIPQRIRLCPVSVFRPIGLDSCAVQSLQTIRSRVAIHVSITCRNDAHSRLIVVSHVSFVLYWLQFCVLSKIEFGDRQPEEAVAETLFMRRIKRNPIELFSAGMRPTKASREGGNTLQ